MRSFVLRTTWKRLTGLIVGGAFLAVFFLVTSASAVETDPVVASSKTAIVDVESGRLQGFIRHGIYTYRGVPYAQAERFMPPVKPAKWNGVRTALSYGFIAPQVVMYPGVGFRTDTGDFSLPIRYFPQNDDCQSLNIWTPGIQDAKKRPVMVWFHGGGFEYGSSIEHVAYDGENLSRKGDVVVVSVNHRLNVMGFLDLSAYGEAYKYSGNLGILDLVAALEWIKNNITQFGGDPGNVTLFGQSGGGAKVSTLMAVPAASGLFHKAIIQSGVLPDMGMGLNDQKISRRVAELTLQNLGLNGTQIDQLAKLPYPQLIKAADKALGMAGQEFGLMTPFGPKVMWRPVWDGDYLPIFPFGDQAAPQSKDIPLLLGTTINEIPFATFDPSMRDLPSWNFEKVKAYLTQRYGAKADAVIAAYRKVYPNLKPNQWPAVDTFFRPGTIRVAQLKSDQKGAPVYTYLFSWESPILDGSFAGWHCAEIPFVFNNIDVADQATGAGKAAHALAGKMSQAWINFARAGNPDAAGLPKWSAFTRENGAIMIFDNTCVVRNHHDDELMKLLTEK